MLPKTTPEGFEPSRAEPTGLAGRRLNHSAKVSTDHCRCRATRYATNIAMPDKGTATKNASAGNRTRVTSMATTYSTTKPLMLAAFGCVPTTWSLPTKCLNTQKTTPGRTRTCNLWIRSPTRYPLRHKGQLRQLNASRALCDPLPNRKQRRNKKRP